MKQSVLLRANGNLYTAEVSEDGICTLNTGETFLLTEDQIKKLSSMEENLQGVLELEQMGRAIAPIEEQEQMPAPPEPPVVEVEEESPKKEKRTKKEKRIKPDPEVMGIEDLEAYKEKLSVVRARREERAKLVALIATILLLLSGIFLFLLNRGTFDPLLRQMEETNIVEEVADEQG